MKTYVNPDKSSWSEILSRPTQSFETIEPAVKEVFDKVKKNGDDAIKRYTAKFDQVELTDLKVSSTEIREAVHKVPGDLKEAILLAKSNIEKFHSAQKT
ncbi:MAG: histidinol dehydrogenase, partial [Bacteroidota bacterium]